MQSKKWKHFLSRTHSLGSFLPVHILSLISINTTEGHMWNCIIFYFFYFLKKKNEMKRDENKTLCWIMRWGWMTWKRSLAFNNDDGKTLYKKNNKQIYLQKKIKKIKTSIFFPSCRPPSSSIHVPFPEIEIKRQLRENFSTTDQDHILRFWTADNNKHRPLSICPHQPPCLPFSLPLGPPFLFLLLPLILLLFLYSLLLCTSENLRYFIK